LFTKRIIPCLDINQGRVVKGVNFKNLRDAGNPVDQARIYDEAGADELIFLDISATNESRETVLDVVRNVADQVFMPLTVGGGIRNVDDIRLTLLAGADKVSLNTAAVKNPSLIEQGAMKFGSQCIVLAIDAKRKAPHQNGLPTWEVITHGGRIHTGIDVIEWAQRAVEYGAGEILLTSMDADGTMQGYDIALTSTVSQAIPVPVIASGGAGKKEHFMSVLTEGLADAALAASLFHDGILSIQDVKAYLIENNIPIRPLGETK
jgi:imidazole glycerol-phosphate synthase subunit HisF